MIPKAKQKPLRRLDRWWQGLYERNYIPQVEAKVRARARNLANKESSALQFADIVGDCFSRKYTLICAGMFFSEFYVNLQEALQIEEMRDQQEAFNFHYQHLDQLVDEVGRRLEKVDSQEKEEQEIVKLIRERFRSKADLVQFKQSHHQVQRLIAYQWWKDKKIDENKFVIMGLVARIEREITPYIVREIIGHLYR